MNSRTRQIFKLAVPSIISNITVPLLGLVDVTIAGHIGDARYISAIAIGTMIFNVIYWVFGFLRMGTSGMTSQALGCRDLEKITHLLIRTLTIGFIIGLFFVCSQWIIIPLGLYIMHPSEEITSLCRQYCYIVIWGAPAMLGQYGITGWLIGMQNTKLPMVVSISQNIVNIIASIFFVFFCHLDIAGVALGTVTAQWFGFCVTVIVINKSYNKLFRYIGEKKKIFAGEEIRKFFAVNRDIFFRTLFLVAVMMFFTAAGSRQGTLILAVNTLLMQFFTIFSYFSDGFAYAGEALSGRYYGAGNISAFRDVVKRLFVIAGWIACAFTLLYIAGGNTFLSLLTSDDNVITASAEYFPWAAAIPLAGVAGFIFDGIFVGITNTKGLLLSSVVAAAVFFTVYLCLDTKMANHDLWSAFIVYLITMGLTEFVIYRRITKKYQ